MSMKPGSGKTGVTMYFHADCTGEWYRGLHRFDAQQPRLLRLGVLVHSTAGHRKVYVAIVRPDPDCSFDSTIVGKHRVDRDLAMRVGIPADEAIGRMRDLITTFAQHEAVDFRVCAYSAKWHRDLVLREADAWGMPPEHAIWSLDTLPLHCVMEAAVPVARVPTKTGRGFKWPTLIEAHAALLGRPLVYDDDAVKAGEQLLDAVAAVDAATLAATTHATTSGEL